MRRWEWDMWSSPFQEKLIRPAFGCNLEQMRTLPGHHTQEPKKVGNASYTGTVPTPQAPKCWQQLQRGRSLSQLLPDHSTGLQGATSPPCPSSLSYKAFAQQSSAKKWQQKDLLLCGPSKICGGYFLAELPLWQLFIPCSLYSSN